MTGTFVTRLFFYGMVAFTPNEELAKKPSNMTAYLLNVADHHPYLAFEIRMNQQCPVGAGGNTECEVTPKIKKGNSWCICRIGKGEHLYFDPAPNQQARQLSPPASSLPSDRDEAAQIDWLFYMSKVTTAKAYPLKSTLLDKSYAEILFGLDSEPKAAQTCQLNQKEKGVIPATRIRPIGFYRKSDGALIHSQAVAEYVMFAQKFAQKPVLHVKERNAQKPYISISLDCANDQCQDLLISNGTTLTNCGGSCGLHFDHYYELLKTKSDVNLEEMKTPNKFFWGSSLMTCDDDPMEEIRKLLAKKPAAYGFTPLVGRFIKIIFTAVDTRIICPMAMFDPPK